MTSYLTLATRTLETFHCLTKSIKKPFLKPEIADRLTAMLNINLKQLCGERARELKVENKEKYGWKPHEMLKLLTDLYLHLQCDQFIDFLAREERSYTPQLFTTAIDTMTRTGIITENGIHQWQELAQKVIPRVILYIHPPCITGQARKFFVFFGDHNWTGQFFELKRLFGNFLKCLFLCF